MVTPSPSRLEFRPTVHARRLVGVFVVMTAGTTTLLGYAVWTLDWIGISVSLTCTLVCGWLAWLIQSMHVRRIFDTEVGRYWSAETRREHHAPPADAVPLAQVRGLQISSKVVEGVEGGEWTAYELNLVLADGRRVNVIDHSHEQQVRAEAAQLGEFLQLPVWTRR